MKSFKKFILTAFVGIATFGSLATFSANNTTTAHADSKVSYAKVKKEAYKQLGKKYVWGATGSKTFDCSGFTQYVYKHAAHKYIPRTAQEQYNYGKKVSTKHMKKGDLVFFGTSKRNIDHVGMYVGGGRMIDAQLRGVITEKVHAPWWHLVGAARV